MFASAVWVDVVAAVAPAAGDPLPFAPVVLPLLLVLLLAFPFTMPLLFTGALLVCDSLNICCDPLLAAKHERTRMSYTWNKRNKNAEKKVDFFIQYYFTLSCRRMNRRQITSVKTRHGLSCNANHSTVVMCMRALVIYVWHGFLVFVNYKNIFIA